MKKIVACIAAAMLLATGMVFSASAASDSFVDDLDREFTKVDSKSDGWQFEDNKDVEKTLYSKKSGVAGEEYLVYKMDKDITGFKIDTLNMNGAGNSETDVKVMVSADGKNWKDAQVTVSDQVMDEAYITPDLAYWMNSTVSNKGAVESGMKYLKVILLPFTGDAPVLVPWRTVLDKVTIELGGSAQATTAPTSAPTAAPTTSATQAETESTTAPESDATTIASAEATTVTSTAAAPTSATTSTPTAANRDGQGTSMLPIIITVVVIVVLVGGGVAAYFLWKKKKAA